LETGSSFEGRGESLAAAVGFDRRPWRAIGRLRALGDGRHGGGRVCVSGSYRWTVFRACLSGAAVIRIQGQGRVQKRVQVTGVGAARQRWRRQRQTVGSWPHTSPRCRWQSSLDWMRIADRERIWSGRAFHSRIDGYAWARGTRLSKPTIREIEMKSLAMANGCLLQHLRHSNSIATQVQICCPESQPTPSGPSNLRGHVETGGAHV
jgi:hypothetical protein